ncbi:hypothetical protein KDK95_28385 [Actinospica sp. MGRD01-02]|uniref:Uncharacterized protein n=1 Tax=Actinospica acidithermotolerans TaxID=2828514 RepID=A0A941EMI3_9ACTN|nr:hypothetical protein [Actinospica acidithermotolerans]MBR7830254.1 hypothetical protein [Actinospica acidithermotolerans]
MYDLEIVIHRGGSQPFRRTSIPTESRVKELAESFLAAWGIRGPDSLRDSAESKFADRLAEIGEYRHDEADYAVVVKRAL